jgi:DNA modification methylase
MHIPYFFLNNNIFSLEGDKVLDSFCGSGTVLLESLIANRVPVGADTNPLARLVTKSKIRTYDLPVLREASLGLVSNIDKRRSGFLPDVVNVDYWFLPKVKRQLSAIAYSISQVESMEQKEFFQVCFSNLIRKVSLADPRVSVPVRLNPLKYPEEHRFRYRSEKILNDLKNIDVLKRFEEIIKQNIKRHEKLQLLTSNRHDVTLCTDARKLAANGKTIRSNSIQLYISSPPYAGAQKYIRSSSLSLGWLGFTDSHLNLKKLDSFTIGRENYAVDEFKCLIQTNISDADKLLKRIYKQYPKRAHIAATYLLEMKESLSEAVRVLKPGGYFVLVAANNQICGEEFKTQEYLCSILESFGLKTVFKLIDDIKSYGLMTKRNKTASIISREWILVFQK